MEREQGPSDRVGEHSEAEDNDRAIWGRVVEHLAEAHDEQTLSTWIKPIACTIRDDRLWLGTPNHYVLDRIKSDFLDDIREAVEAATGSPIKNVSILTDSHEGLRARAAKESAPTRHQTRGRTSESVVERAQLKLFDLERAGQFAAYPVSPNNEFPTLLTRLPLFKPGRASSQAALLDKDLALPFATSWGDGRKFGPPLTVYDEDTLMAIGRLRQNMLIGHPNKMPAPISAMYRADGEEDVRVHVVYCMLGDIQDMCGTSKGGRNNKLRLASIKRLAATKIEFSRETQEKTRSGTTIDLIHVKWEEYEDSATLYIQFSPVMVTWLENAYTYIDWNIRRQLTSDVGKAVHRFLSGQPKSYSIFTRKLQATIGHQSSYKEFSRLLREALGQLQDLGWLESWSIEGNGRSKPHKLILKR